MFEALYVTHTPVEQVCARFSMTPVAIYCFRTLRAFMSGSCSTIWPSVRALHARALADGAAVSDIIVNGRGTMIYLTAPEGYYVEVSCQKRRFGPAPQASA